jgi:hypothetical protein
MSLKKYKSQGKAVDMTVNNMEENSEDFFLDFVQEFGLRPHSRDSAHQRDGRDLTT